MTENVRALEYVEQCIKELNTSFNVSTSYRLFAYFVKASLDDNEHTIYFSRDLIDDFEVALEKYEGTTYFTTLESAIKFKIYVKLGSAGLLPQFEVSDAIINEKREWIKEYQVDVFFDEEITEVLNQGLNDLISFFDSLIEGYPDLDLTKMEEHKEWVKNLIRYYEKEGTLNLAGVEIRNLQYLKAAALRQILDLEEKRRNEKKPSIKQALNKKIYFVVSKLRRDPFLEVKLPDFVHDLVAEKSECPMSPFNRVAGGFSPPAPTTPRMRVRTGRFTETIGQ